MAKNKYDFIKELLEDKRIKQNHRERILELASREISLEGTLEQRVQKIEEILFKKEGEQMLRDALNEYENSTEEKKEKSSAKPKSSESTAAKPSQVSILGFTGEGATVALDRVIELQSYGYTLFKIKSTKDLMKIIGSQLFHLATTQVGGVPLKRTKILLTQDQLSGFITTLLKKEVQNTGVIFTFDNVNTILDFTINTITQADVFEAIAKQDEFERYLYPTEKSGIYQYPITVGGETYYVESEDIADFWAKDSETTLYSLDVTNLTEFNKTEATDTKALDELDNKLITLFNNLTKDNYYDTVKATQKLIIDYNLNPKNKERVKEEPAIAALNEKLKEIISQKIVLLNSSLSEMQSETTEQAKRDSLEDQKLTIAKLSDTNKEMLTDAINEYKNSTEEKKEESSAKSKPSESTATKLSQVSIADFTGEGYEQAHSYLKRLLDGGYTHLKIKSTKDLMEIIGNQLFHLATMEVGESSANRAKMLLTQEQLSALIPTIVKPESQNISFVITFDNVNTILDSMVQTIHQSTAIEDFKQYGYPTEKSGIYQYPITVAGEIYYVESEEIAEFWEKKDTYLYSLDVTNLTEFNKTEATDTKALDELENILAAKSLTDNGTTNEISNDSIKQNADYVKIKTYYKSQDLYNFLKDFHQNYFILKPTSHAVDSDDLSGICEYCEFEKYNHEIFLSKIKLEYENLQNKYKEKFVSKNMKALIWTYLFGGGGKKWDNNITINWSSLELIDWCNNNAGIPPNPDSDICNEKLTQGFVFQHPIQPKLKLLKEDGVIKNDINNFSELCIHFKHLFHIRADNQLKDIIKNNIINVSPYSEWDIDLDGIDFLEYYTDVSKLIQFTEKIFYLINDVVKAHPDLDQTPKINLSFNDLGSFIEFKIHHINTVFKRPKNALSRPGKTLPSIIKNQVNGMGEFELMGEINTGEIYEIKLWNWEIWSKGGEYKVEQKTDSHHKGVAYILKMKK